MMRQVFSYIALVLQLFIVEGQGGVLLDIPKYGISEDIEINNNYEKNKNLFDIEENDLWGNTSDTEFDQRINDDDLHFDDTTSDLARGYQDKKNPFKLAPYIAFFTAFVSATLLWKTALFGSPEKLNDFEDITKKKHLRTSGINDDNFSTTASNPKKLNDFEDITKKKHLRTSGINDDNFSTTASNHLVTNNGNFVVSGNLSTAARNHPIIYDRTFGINDDNLIAASNSLIINNGTSDASDNLSTASGNQPIINTRTFGINDDNLAAASNNLIINNGTYDVSDEVLTDVTNHPIINNGTSDVSDDGVLTDVTNHPIINKKTFGVSDDKFSTTASTYSGKVSQDSSSDDGSFGYSPDVESDESDDSDESEEPDYEDITEEEVQELMAKLKEEAFIFKHNFYKLADEEETADEKDKSNIAFQARQNLHAWLVKKAEIQELNFLSSKPLGEPFNGEFMTTGRVLKPNILERKQDLLDEVIEKKLKNNEPEMMPVADMKLTEADDKSKQDLVAIYDLENNGNEFYPNVSKIGSPALELLAHFKMLSPLLPVDNPNEFHIEFDKVSDSFTGKPGKTRIYKIETLYGVGSTALILGGRPVDKNGRLSGERLALKIVFERIIPGKNYDTHFSRITAGEEILLDAAAAQQRHLGLPVNAESASERTGILFPVKSMLLTTKPGAIVTRKYGGIMIHPQVYAYPAMAVSFDHALQYYPDRRDHVVEYFAKNLILSAAHMHSMGVVHLDEKPDNILVGPSGRLYLCDFSFVRPIGDIFEEEKLMNEIFLDYEGQQFYGKDIVSDAIETMDSWRIGLSILDAAKLWKYDGKPFDPKSIDFHSINEISKTLVNIVSDLMKPFRNRRLTPAQIIEKYPEFFGIRKNENEVPVPEPKHA